MADGKRPAGEFLEEDIPRASASASQGMSDYIPNLLIII